MAELEARSPFAGLEVPLSSGNAVMREVELSALRLLLPWDMKGFEKDLKAQLKLDVPSVGRCASGPAGRLIWAGLDAYLLEGDAAFESTHSAVSDQSSGWAALSLEGADAGAVMARLTPLDTAAMVPGDVALSEAAHMRALVLRSEEGFELRVARSFARTLHREVMEAMERVAARAGG